LKVKVSLSKSDTCRSCGNCCKKLVLPVNKPLEKSNQSLMFNWLEARGLDIINEVGDILYVKIDTKCPHLKLNTESTYSKNGLVKSAKISYECDIYSERPEGCRLFDGRNLDFLDCMLKSKDSFVVLEKSIKGSIGMRKFQSSSERKRQSRRKSAEKRQTEKEDIAAYGESQAEEKTKGW
jgi:hypothetical protein